MTTERTKQDKRPGIIKGLIHSIARIVETVVDVRSSSGFREEGYASPEDYVINGIMKPRLQSVELIPQYHEFIALNTHLIKQELDFIAGNKLINPAHSKRFLDVGCGTGNVMLFAATFGFIPFGIEYNPVLVRSAPYRHLKQYSPAETGSGIYQQDALEFLHYGDFDVVYLYCPIADQDLEIKLENVIERQLKKGALYVANLKQDQSIMENPDFEYLGTSNKLPIWRKIR